MFCRMRTQEVNRTASKAKMTASSGKGYSSNRHRCAVACVLTHNHSYTQTLDDEEIGRSDEAANGMERAMMEQELLLIVLFNSEDLLNVTDGRPGRVA